MGEFLTSVITQRTFYVPVIILFLVVLMISAFVTWIEYDIEVERENRRSYDAQDRQDWNAMLREKPDYDKEILDFDYEMDFDYEFTDSDFDDFDIVDLGLFAKGLGVENADEYDYTDVEPIIVVDDICMDFKIETQDVSGVKEWMIKKVKGKISYRTLHALSHISFQIYPGEVIGIIGTNGSGKSTLLKIISGALEPTSGHVQADRKKIQMLTLGTGFDMELTARENVYLNGSIIGYSREFIDEHYDSIVAFAELKDFMEEKVKNFSSGMVSRLGFAIATAGDAAEILILDEVLSVGDEFFRKKSLERIQAMIHSGSTVLMVSHGMGTIMKNCSRAVWIEKGVFKMIGDTKTVCEAYQKMNG